MSHPTAQEVRVATDALRTEAGIWDDQSGQMEQISSKVKGMELGRIEAGVFQLIVDPYNDVVQQVTSRADEGVTAMTNIGNTLRQVATTYDEEDVAGEHRMRDLY